MKTTTETSSETSVAATLAPEDVACGDYVALLKVTYELPTYLWDAAQALMPADELVRLALIPPDSGVPLKVFAVCLPFVYVKSYAGEIKTLDLRREQIVRLHHESAKAVWKELKPDKTKSC
ncbi:hypothetical protein [Anatilimnocola floriformis]|uniref:hypothetical protein n=1 Tax=Anatilimnocola floriformis TaxID=2948575 RepID=UPI0020C41940|nr:hypothetical protein [Anatilimnocola floriformis]